jgi:murein DD-endopeptidase MepM/ murein hydrolase activator NlpD
MPSIPQMPADSSVLPAARLPGTKAGGFLSASFPYKAGRLDQGQDFQTSPGAPIMAPGSGVVLSVKSDPHGFGPAYPIVHFTTGPYAGKNVYIGHTLTQVRPGQRFQQGQVLSHTGSQPVGNAAVPGWAEIGFANSLGLPGPDGQQVPF